MTIYSYIDTLSKEFTNKINKCQSSLSRFKSKLKNFILPLTFGTAFVLDSFSLFLAFKYPSGNTIVIALTFLFSSIYLLKHTRFGYISAWFNPQKFHQSILTDFPPTEAYHLPILESLTIDKHNSLLANVLVQGNKLTLDDLTSHGIQYIVEDDVILILKENNLASNLKIISEHALTELLSAVDSQPHTNIFEIKQKLQQLEQTANNNYQKYVTYMLQCVFNLFKLSPSKHNFDIIMTSYPFSHLKNISQIYLDTALECLINQKTPAHNEISSIDKEQLAMLEDILKDTTLAPHLKLEAELLKLQITQAMAQPTENNHKEVIQSVAHYFKLKGTI